MITIEDIEKYEEGDICIRDLVDIKSNIFVCFNSNPNPNSEYFRVYIGLDDISGNYRVSTISLYEPKYIEPCSILTKDELDQLIIDINNNWNLITSSLINEYRNSKWYNNELYHKCHKDDVKLPPIPPDYSLLEVL